MYISRAEVEKAIELFEKKAEIEMEIYKGAAKKIPGIIEISEIPDYEVSPEYCKAKEHLRDYLAELGCEKLLDLSALMWYGGWKPLGEYSFYVHRKEAERYLDRDKAKSSDYIMSKGAVAHEWLKRGTQMLDKYGISVREV